MQIILLIQLDFCRRGNGCGCVLGRVTRRVKRARSRARTAHTHTHTALRSPENELLMVAGNEEWPDSLHTLYFSPCNGVLVDYPFGVPLAFDSFISFKLLSGAGRYERARRSPYSGVRFGVAVCRL